MSVHAPRRCRVEPGVSLVFALAFSVTFAELARADEPESIEWRDDYGTALEEARTANRPLWIQFTGPWCPNCTRMERDSFVKPAIIQHARRSFVPLKLRSDVDQELAANFKLSGLPATIIVAPNRDIVAMHQGYLAPEDFDRFLRDCLAQHGGKPEQTGVAARSAFAPVQGSASQTNSSSEPELALSGYCAVSLVCDRRLVRGRLDYSIGHEGRIYRFANLEMKDRFRNEPERFVPVNNGACPVTQVERGTTKQGDPRCGVLYGGHLVLCASQSDRLLFVKNPEVYAMVDVADGGFCVHCRRESGLLVRGDPRHEFARQGRRYWFPDTTHRDAFVASLR